MRAWPLALLAPLGIWACQTADAQSPPDAAPTVTQGTGEMQVEVVAQGLDTPWEFEWLPDGRMLITERPGTLRVIENGELRSAPLATIADAVETGGEGGLLGLAVHPDFAEKPWIYVAYTYSQGRGWGVRVERYTLEGDTLSDPKTILDGIEGGRNHDGTALAFGPDGKLFITTGEKYDRDLAQDMMSLNGKTLRVNDDGTIPGDNPWAGDSSARPEIWSIGHRNAQGIDWHPTEGYQLQAEHGPSGADGPGGGDEVNLIEKGENYGWPLVSHDKKDEGLIHPLAQWTPAIAPGGAAFYSGPSEAWKGDFFIACLRGQALIRLDMEAGEVKGEERLLLREYGRLRAVGMGPDGALYVGTSNKDGRARARDGDDRILRIIGP